MFALAGWSALKLGLIAAVPAGVYGTILLAKSIVWTVGTAGLFMHYGRKEKAYQDAALILAAERNGDHGLEITEDVRKWAQATTEAAEKPTIVEKGLEWYAGAIVGKDSAQKRALTEYLHTAFGTPNAAAQTP
jgi:hypothetical protein